MTRLVAIAGPSGAGKDMLMALACAADPGIRAARRVITRPAEAGGEDFDGVTEAEFARRLAASEFALHWRAHGLGYGIPAAELAGVGTVLMNLSRAVLAKAVAHLPGLTVLLVTAPPRCWPRGWRAGHRTLKLCARLGPITTPESASTGRCSI